MDFLADLSKAASERLRTPIFVLISLSFIAYNWQPIWYLFFADCPVRQKFLYFDANTSSDSLLLNPIVTGVVLTVLSQVLSQWMQVVGALIARLPSRLMARIHTTAYRERKSDEMKFKTNEIVIQADQMDKIDQLEAKETLQTKRDEARNNIGHRLVEELKNRILSETARSLLMEASRDNGEILVSCVDGATTIRAGQICFDSKKNPRGFDQFESAICTLVDFDLIKGDRDEQLFPEVKHYKMTFFGKEVSDQLS